MTDLVDMLNFKNLGVLYKNGQIPCLLYADDVVLIANSEEQLKSMLNVADDFVKKWGMTFNQDKSKIMVIGKRTDPNRKWLLGNHHLTECSEYKYLGIMFSKTLSDTYHIKSYLASKVSRLRGYLCSILSAHENVNRVSFGDSIWKSVILPSLSHGSAVWLNTTKEAVGALSLDLCNIQ